jgi:hypothetical protein
MKTYFFPALAFVVGMLAAAGPCLARGQSVQTTRICSNECAEQGTDYWQYELDQCTCLWPVKEE